ncbi:MAG TPA: LuxR C-terminal-related transcriptional regulator [Myxococcota bacterium]|nr:LuxR C-terminal-related transcriptional regulator [Myxococcota bacterium]
MADWISLVEASYSLEGDVASWSDGVLQACGSLLGSDKGLVACHFRRTEADFEIESIHTRPSFGAEAAVRGILGSEGARVARDLVFRRGAEFAALSEQVPERADCVANVFRKMSGGRFSDGCGGIAHSGDGRAIAIGVPLRERRAAHPATRERWSQVAGHLGAGLRLLHALHSRDSEEAVLDPSGRVCHAQGAAESPSAREVLRAAARRIDAARTREGRSDADAALASWDGLVGGRWSLIDRFESDGRRYLVALRNDPEIENPRGLSREEAQVAEFLALGHSEKQIAYALGISTSAVSRRICASIRKLGLRSRAELAALFAVFDRGCAAREWRVGGNELRVASCASATTPRALDGLSCAEREVAGLVSHGYSDAQIACARGASPRTVANQLHGIYRKLGIHSRTELAARLTA